MSQIENTAILQKSTFFVTFMRFFQSMQQMIPGVVHSYDYYNALKQ